MADSLTVYHYPACGTCKKARKWLESEGIEHTLVHIVEQTPDRATLAAAWRASGLPLKRFFNTSGQSYRGGGFKDRLPTMSDEAQLDALAADGKLIKRPLAILPKPSASGVGALVGFKQAEWQDALRS
jgi:arsenate reductase